MTQSSYDTLVQTGAIGSLKRDVLLEATRDIEYVASIQSRLAGMGAEAKRDRTANTVRLIRELLDGGFCKLATWRDKDIENLDDAADIESVVQAADEPREPFRFFLVGTDAAKEWVKRYDALVCEL